MNFEAKISEKEELLKQVIGEIDTRKEQINKLNEELVQLETQGYVIQGAILAYKELIEEETSAEIEPSDINESN